MPKDELAIRDEFNFVLDHLDKLEELLEGSGLIDELKNKVVDVAEKLNVKLK